MLAVCWWSMEDREKGIQDCMCIPQSGSDCVYNCQAYEWLGDNTECVYMLALCATQLAFVQQPLYDNTVNV